MARGQHIGRRRGQIGLVHRIDVALIVAFYPAGPWPIKVPDTVWDLGSPVRVPGRLRAGRIRPVDQLPIDLGADRSFH